MFSFKCIEVRRSLWSFILPLVACIPPILGIVLYSLPKWIMGELSAVLKVKTLRASMIIPFAALLIYRCPVLNVECTKNSITVKNIFGKILKCYEIEDKVNIGIAINADDTSKKEISIYITGRDLSDIAIKCLVDCYYEQYREYVFCFKYNQKTLLDLGKFYNCEIKTKNLLNR